MESGLHDEFPVSEQEVAMPTTRETHHSGKICRFFLLIFFTSLNFNKKINWMETYGERADVSKLYI